MYLSECQKPKWGVLGLGKMRIMRNRSEKLTKNYPWLISFKKLSFLSGCKSTWYASLIL
jgi:hypothetical protein